MGESIPHDQAGPGDECVALEAADQASPRFPPSLTGLSG